MNGFVVFLIIVGGVVALWAVQTAVGKSGSAVDRTVRKKTHAAGRAEAQTALSISAPIAPGVLVPSIVSTVNAHASAPALVPGLCLKEADRFARAVRLREQGERRHLRCGRAPLRHFDGVFGHLRGAPLDGVGCGCVGEGRDGQDAGPGGGGRSRRLRCRAAGLTDPGRAAAPEEARPRPWSRSDPTQLSSERRPRSSGRRSVANHTRSAAGAAGSTTRRFFWGLAGGRGAASGHSGPRPLDGGGTQNFTTTDTPQYGPDPVRQVATSDLGSGRTMVACTEFMAGPRGAAFSVTVQGMSGFAGQYDGELDPALTCTWLDALIRLATH